MPNICRLSLTRVRHGRDNPRFMFSEALAAHALDRAPLVRRVLASGCTVASPHICSSGPPTFRLSWKIMPRPRRPSLRERHAVITYTAQPGEARTKHGGRTRAWKVRGRGADGCSRRSAKLALAGRDVYDVRQYNCIYTCARAHGARRLTCSIPRRSSCSMCSHIRPTPPCPPPHDCTVHFMWTRP